MTLTLKTMVIMRKHNHTVDQHITEDIKNQQVDSTVTTIISRVPGIQVKIQDQNRDFILSIRVIKENKENMKISMAEMAEADSQGVADLPCL